MTTLHSSTALTACTSLHSTHAFSDIRIPCNVKANFIRKATTVDSWKEVQKSFSSTSFSLCYNQWCAWRNCPKEGHLIFHKQSGIASRV